MRRRLPHFDGSHVTQFVTFRLADSLPQTFLEEIRQELQSVKSNVEQEKYERIQHYLDQGAGSCLLRNQSCAKIVQDALQFLDGKKYLLRAWVVMPNHVHFLARFEEGQLLSKALHSLKSFTAHELIKLHPEMPSVWQHESFDRYIRDEDHYWQTVNYIHNNPVSAGLCKSKEEFRWSSAFEQH